MGLTYGEIEFILDMKYFDASSTGYTLLPGLYEISDLNLMLKSLLPNEVKVNITIDDNKIRSNLTTNKTIKFTRKTLLGFTQSHSGPSNDPPEGYIQKISGTYKSETPINITG